MNKITAVIIEDEIPAARRLNNTLNELRPEWQPNTPLEKYRLLLPDRWEKAND